MLPFYDQVRIFLSNEIVENLKFRRNIYHQRLKFLLHTFSYTFIRATKFQNFLSCWWSGLFCFFIYSFDSSFLLFFCVRCISLRKRLLTLTETFMRIALGYRQASESPPHPFQGCSGPLSACHLGFSHSISNSRRMTWATYHTPQAAYYFTGILFHIAVFTLNNYFIKRRKENCCGGNCCRPYWAVDNLPQ